MMLILRGCLWTDSFADIQLYYDNNENNEAKASDPVESWNVLHRGEWVKRLPRSMQPLEQSSPMNMKIAYNMLI